MPIPPPALSSYLTSTGSLTALLEKKAGKPLTVQVLCECIKPLTIRQKHQLGLPPNRPQLAKIRTVLLYGNDIAWVQATSIFPLSSLTGELKRLSHLGNTPIGYVLFKKYRKLPHRRQYYQTNGCHGRRTLYNHQGRPLLIDELFLDNFANICSS
ncbi:chorismate lyase [Moraxella sp.]|uniref:chorismate--pyruvate lyase family protein n=1 Tax=Moraxella sp. TaxID=479 RepID=UPI0026DAC6A7|nr:chorismate lyase [Moraxella sp.]MDO4894979.1 chorismate lyase [Moraxella sp.]